jgi:hypothetical protein
VLDCAQSVPRPATSRSALTNDPLKLRGIDGRSMDSRRYRDLVLAFVEDLGGADQASETDKALEKVVLDGAIERKAPFSPDSVVEEFAATPKSYRISTVVGDRYAREWPRERFQVHGVRYEPSELNRSELYLAFLPFVNWGVLSCSTVLGWLRSSSA